MRLVPRESRVAVLLNANAKRVGSRIQKVLSKLVPRDDLFLSTTLDEAEAHARSIIARRYTTVLSGGGDGTLTNTMNMLLRASEQAGRAQARHALPDIGILRLGTGNGLASLTRAGRPVDDVLRALAGEQPVAHPLRLIQDQTGWVFPFCSMGYDAQVLNDYVSLCEDTRSSFGRKLAKTLAGYFYALGTRTIPHELKGERAHVRITATGRSSIMDPETDEEIPLQSGATLFEGVARSISAGTSPYYGFGLMVHPFARRRMDRFHLRVSSASISYLLSHLPSLWKGTMRTSSVVDFLVEGVVIETSTKMPLQTAGDARGFTNRLELRLSDRAFRLLEGSAAEKH